MKGPLDERTPPMTPQLALRVAIIGCFALVMFAVIFFRLWFLQVLSGSQYVEAAQVNIVRDVPVPAERGEILDRSGTALVESERVPAIQIAPDELPVHVTQANMIHQPARDYPLYDKLAGILRMSTKPHACSFYTYGNGLPVQHSPRLAPIPCLIAQNVSQAEYANVTIKADVSPDIQAYIAEHGESVFPGVADAGGLPAQVSARRRRRAGLRHARRDQLNRGRHEAVQGHQAGQYRRPVGPGVRIQLLPPGRRR